MKLTYTQYIYIYIFTHIYVYKQNGKCLGCKTQVKVYID